MSEKLWHAMPIEKIYSALETHPDRGLSTAAVHRLQEKYGKNVLPSKRRLTGVTIFFNQFKSPLVYILIAAAIISAVLRDLVDAAVIMVAVMINTLLGFYQESKANNALDFLRKLVDYKTRVLRDGREIEISSRELVPGDLIFLRAGDKIPADGRLVSADSFQVIEAALTGESAPSDKQPDAIDRGVALADRENMAYSGTVVARGVARVIVTATGVDTELGKITVLLHETPEEATPLQRQLKKFSQALTLIVLGIAALIVVIGKLQGREVLGYGESAREGMLNTAVAIAVAAIPEGLLIAVTAILAMGMQSILKQKALIRRLVAAETLGSTSVICTDKTGTLTEGKMQVAQILTFNDTFPFSQSVRYTAAKRLADHELILKISVLCNDAQLENPEAGLEEWKVIGDPTESALLIASLSSGIEREKIEQKQPRLEEVLFDSDRKYMLTLNKLNSRENVIYAKGAPEKILAVCDRVRSSGKKEKLTEARLAALRERYELLTSQGYRILAFAYRQMNNHEIPKDLTAEMTSMVFAGFVALKDPLRPEAKATFALTRQAGITTVIVTGDHPLTARAIVSELGIATTPASSMEGAELDKLSDDELQKIIRSITVFARVEPRHKLRIVNAWQAVGEVVAMTGDGVNDAPAIKAADIGIAFGSGTDVAKETSDIILLDNNFKTIVSAIERGRVIFDNIKKVILYLLADSFSEVILVTGALLLALPLPVLPAQILWINLITDGFPNLALTMEPGERLVMNEKPLPKNRKILDRQMKALIFIVGIVIDVVLLGLFFFLLRKTDFTIEHIRTFIFVALGIDSLFYVFSCRSLRRPIWRINLFSNPYLLVAVVAGFVLQLLPLYVPFLQRLLGTVPLTMADWVFLLGLAVFKLFAIELTKNLFINRRPYALAAQSS